jgi:hypothetical protein
VDEQYARQLIADHFAVAGRDEVAAAEIFTDDAVIEWPQSGERIVGKPNIVALHEAAPVRIDIDVGRSSGCGDLWVTEATIRYDGARPTGPPRLAAEGDAAHHPQAAPRRRVRRLSGSFRPGRAVLRGGPACLRPPWIPGSTLRPQRA